MERSRERDLQDEVDNWKDKHTSRLNMTSSLRDKVSKITNTLRKVGRIPYNPKYKPKIHLETQYFKSPGQ